MNPVGAMARVALASLRANKLRTVLTVIGVVIGIGTIIGMLALINGINRSVMAEFKRLGPNVLYVTREEPGLRIGHGRGPERKRIDSEVAEALRRSGPSMDLSIMADGRAKAAFRGRRSGMATVRGVDAQYFDIAKLDLDEGRFFGLAEARRSRVCVLGWGIVESLFGRVSPVGKTVEIEGRDFEVVGTLEESGVVFGSSSDEVVVIPYQPFETIFGKAPETLLMASAPEDMDTEDAVESLRLRLRSVRRIRVGEDDDFAISTQESLLDTYKKLTGSIYWVMRIVASVALLVSGIGIMNIMLVVVMERTREVGLRKAVGATRKAVMSQFLIEAVMLTLLGGAAGISLGFLISLAVSSLTSLPAAVPVWAVPLALGICCAIGIFFGFYPAFRASGLDPVRALRYE